MLLLEMSGSGAAGPTLSPPIPLGPGWVSPREALRVEVAWALQHPTPCPFMTVVHALSMAQGLLGLGTGT